MSQESSANAAFIQLWDQLSKAELLHHRNLVLSLLFLRLVSETYRPACYQLCLEDIGNAVQPEASQATPWSTLAENGEGDYNQALVRAGAAFEETAPSMRGEVPWAALASQAEAKEMADLVEQLSYLEIPKQPDRVCMGFVSFLQFFTAHDSLHQGDFYMPEDIAQCLYSLIAPIYNSFYDPYCKGGALLAGVASFADGLEIPAMTGWIQNKDDAFLCKMNLYLSAYHAHIDIQSDEVEIFADRGQKFDCILASPPFNQADWCDSVDEEAPCWMFGVPPKSNANFAWLQHIVYHLNKYGRGAVLLSNGSLTSRTTREQTIRNAMVSAGLVEGIITLPPGLFYSTKVPCCIWLLDKKNVGTGKMFFVDGRNLGQKTQTRGKKNRLLTQEEMEDLCELVAKFRCGSLEGKTQTYAVASLQEVADHGGILSPDRYTLSPIQPKQGVKSPSHLSAITLELQALLQKEESLNRQLKRQLEGIGLVI